MSFVASTIQRLFESGQSPGQICKLLKGGASRSGVYKALKSFRETGSTLSKVRSTPERKVRASKLIRNTREKIRRNPERSVRKLALSSCVSYGMMQKVLTSDNNLSPFKRTKAQLLSEATKPKRLQRAKLLLEKLRDGTQPPVLWTDEKLFTVQAVHNHQNDRIFAVNKRDIHLNEWLMFRRQKLASVMVWTGVTSSGKKSPLFIIEEGVKVNQQV